MNAPHHTLTLGGRVNTACRRIRDALTKADRFPFGQGEECCVVTGDSKSHERVVKPHASADMPVLRGLRLAVNGGYLVLRSPGSRRATYAPFDIENPDYQGVAPAIARQLERLADEIEGWERGRSSGI